MFYPWTLHWSQALPLLLLCLQTVVNAGNSCLQGIVGCTQSMRKRDLAAISVEHPCRALTEYTQCLGEACAAHPVTCEVQRARHQMFQLMQANGIQCDAASDLGKLKDVCSSSMALSRSSSSSSQPSMLSSFPSLSTTTSASIVLPLCYFLFLFSSLFCVPMFFNFPDLI